MKHSIRTEVYSLPHCQQCDATKKQLHTAHIAFIERDAAAYHDFLTKRLGARTAPVVVVYVDDKYGWHFTGYSPDMIDQLAQIIEDGAEE